MKKLSELINAEFEKKDKIRAEIRGGGYLGLDLSKNEVGGYDFLFRIQGTLSETDAFVFMADFLRGLDNSGLDESSFYVDLNNGQDMYLDQRPIPGTFLCHYIVKFRSLVEQEDSMALMPLLGKIAKDLYEIEFDCNIPYELPIPGPFKEGNSLEKGAMLYLPHGLVHGTVYEKEAREIILRLIDAGRLMEEDIDIFRKYDRALVEDMPTIDCTEGIVIQKNPKCESINFLKFLDNISEDVRRLNLTLFCEDYFLIMGNAQHASNILEKATGQGWIKDGTPNIQLILPSVGKNKVNYFLDHVWDKYHLISGDPIKIVEDVLKEE